MNSRELREAVNARLVSVLSNPPRYLTDQASQELFREFAAPGLALCSQGKRTRALLLAAGFEAVNRDLLASVDAAVALELYQASALVHDDIVDEADTRRGMPAIHCSFAQTHAAQSLIGDGTSFGYKAALLLGDYLLSLASEVMESVTAADEASRVRGRLLFHEMTAETAFGQYLDMRAEFTALGDDADAAIESALLVLRHKSARYSVELPLLIGGALAGGTEEELATLQSVGRPLGEAFQLRDDELGIFGDPAVTGKPAGGDITEGKRTVLLALTRDMCSPADREFLDGVLGHELSEGDVDIVRSIMRSSGAFARHEAMIKERELAARNALPADAPLLAELLDSLTGRRY